MNLIKTIISILLISILLISTITVATNSSSDSNSNSNSDSDSFNFSSDSNSDSSDDKHYIYAFAINLNPYEGQYFIIIDPAANQVLKNVSVNTPQDFVIQSILGFDKSDNLIYLLGLSGLYASNAVFQYNINTGNIQQVNKLVPQFDMGYAVQPFVYTSAGELYMAIEPLTKNILALAEWQFPIGKKELIELKVSNFSTKIYPLLAYQEQTELIYVVYSPAGNSNETQLIVIDSNNPTTQKQFTTIKNLTLSADNNLMLLSSPTNQSIYLIQSNLENNGMDMCEFDLSSSSSSTGESVCNNVMSVTMVKDFTNAPFNPFQLTLDNSGLIVMNYVGKKHEATEVTIVDLDSLFPIASYTINNYFNSTDPDIQYFISYY